MIPTVDVLFAMPHPDDLEITCGGTIARLVELGYRVGMLHLTNGEPTPRGTPQTRAQESAAAAECLGATFVHTLDLTNRELMDGPAARYAVATVIRRCRPQILVGPYGRTPAASPDHYQGQLIVEAARFYSQLSKWDERFDSTAPHVVAHLWYRPLAIAAEHSLWPATFVVDVSRVHEKKVAAISCYASQFDESRLAGLLHRVRAIDAADGGRCGFSYGELFAIPQPLPMLDPVAHFAPALPRAGAYPPKEG